MLIIFGHTSALRSQVLVTKPQPMQSVREEINKQLVVPKKQLSFNIKIISIKSSSDLRFVIRSERISSLINSKRN